MNDLELSTRTRSLLDAAKADGPSQLSKAKIWGGVAATTAAAAGAGASAGSAAALGSGKLIVAGALFGSAVTVGLAMALMHVGPPAPAPVAPRAATQLVAPSQPGPVVAPAPKPNDDEAASQAIATSAAASPPAAITPVAKGAAKGAGASSPPAGAIAKPGTRPRATADRDELLEREGFLVSEARGALARGDARAALSAVRAAQRLDSHALDPEELALEARALRALGSDDAAAATEARLRARYPDHALAR